MKTVMFLLAIMMVSLASAGFASTFLPEVDGVPNTLVIEQGETASYFLYPQNFGEESVFMKIDITYDNASLLSNELEAQYEIPADTQSDSFPVELRFTIPKDAERGKFFEFKYSVLTSSGDNVSAGGMVSFGSAGFGKTINIKVHEDKPESNIDWKLIMFLIIAGIALVVLIYLIKRWWDNRGHNDYSDGSNMAYVFSAIFFLSILMFPMFPMISAADPVNVTVNITVTNAIPTFNGGGWWIWTDVGPPYIPLSFRDHKIQIELNDTDDTYIDVWSQLYVNNVSTGVPQYYNGTSISFIPGPFTPAQWTNGNYSKYDNLTVLIEFGNSYLNSSNATHWVSTLFVYDTPPSIPTNCSSQGIANILELSQMNLSCDPVSDFDGDTPIYVYYEIYNVNDSLMLQNYSADNNYTATSNDTYDILRVRALSINSDGNSTGWAKEPEGTTGYMEFNITPLPLAYMSANSTTPVVDIGDDFEVNVTASGAGNLWTWTQKYINGAVEGTVSVVQVVGGVMANVASFLAGTFSPGDNLTAEVFIVSEYGNTTPVNFTITVDTVSATVSYANYTINNTNATLSIVLGAVDEFETYLDSYVQLYVNDVANGPVQYIDDGLTNATLAEVAYLYNITVGDNITAEYWVDNTQINTTKANLTLTIPEYIPQLEFVSPTLGNNTIAGAMTLTIKLNDTSLLSLSSGTMYLSHSNGTLVSALSLPNTATPQAGGSETMWQPLSLQFNGDGSVLYGAWREWNTYTYEAFSYNLSTPYDITTVINSSLVIKNINHPSTSTSVKDIAISSDGTTMLVANYHRLDQWTLTTPWNISTAVFANDITLGETALGGGYGVEINAAKDKFWLMDAHHSSYQGDILEYSYTGNNVSTAVATGNVLTGDAILTKFAFSPDGYTIGAFSGNTNGAITAGTYHSYNLSTAYDITTAVFTAGGPLITADPYVPFTMGPKSGGYDTLYLAEDETGASYVTSTLQKYTLGAAGTPATYQYYYLADGNYTYYAEATSSAGWTGYSENRTVEVKHPTFSASPETNFTPNLSTVEINCFMETYGDDNVNVSYVRIDDGVTYIYQNESDDFQTINASINVSAVNASIWRCSGVTTDGDPFATSYRTINVATPAIEFISPTLANLAVDGSQYLDIAYNETNGVFVNGTLYVNHENGTLVYSNTTIGGSAGSSVLTATDVSPALGYGPEYKTPEFSPDGTKVFFHTGFVLSSYDIVSYNLTTPYNITTIDIGSVVEIASPIPSAHGISMSGDGTRLFQISGGSTIYEYSLSTPWDLSTAALTAFNPIGAVDLSFNNDGTSMYVLDSVGNIQQYSLAGDVSTASYVTGKSAGAANDFEISADGTTIGLVSAAGYYRTWTMSVPWDISSATDNNDQSASASFGAIDFIDNNTLVSLEKQGVPPGIMTAYSTIVTASVPPVTHTTQRLDDGIYGYYVNASNSEGVITTSETRLVNITHPVVSLNLSGAMREWDYPTVASPYGRMVNASCTVQTFGTTTVANSSISSQDSYVETWITNNTGDSTATLFYGNTTLNATNTLIQGAPYFPNNTVTCSGYSDDGEFFTDSVDVETDSTKPYPWQNQTSSTTFNRYVSVGEDAFITFTPRDDIGLEDSNINPLRQGCVLDYGDGAYPGPAGEAEQIAYYEEYGIDNCTNGFEKTVTVPFIANMPVASIYTWDSWAWTRPWAGDVPGSNESQVCETAIVEGFPFAEFGCTQLVIPSFNYKGIVWNQTYDENVSDTEVSTYEIVFTPNRTNGSGPDITDTIYSVTHNGYGANVAATLASQDGDIYTYTANQNQQDGFTGIRSFYWTIVTDSGTYTTQVLSQIVLDLDLYRCTNLSTEAYIAFKTYDEETLLPIAAAVDDARLLFSEGSPTYKEFLDVNGTEIVDAYYCYDDPTEVINVEAIFKYSAAGYPLRTHSNDYVGLTNNTTIANIYLLAADQGSYVTVLVTDIANNPLPDSHITWNRNIAGVPNIIGQDDTDDTGSATFWLNPDFPHTVTTENDDCDTQISTITPAQPSYVVQLICDSQATYTYDSTRKGVSFDKNPGSGVIRDGDDETEFEYRVRSKIYNMTAAKFSLHEFGNLSNTIAENVTYTDVNSEYCTPNRCVLSLTVNTTEWPNIIGRYSVLMEGETEWVLLEADGQWYKIPSLNRTGTLMSFFSSFRDMFETTLDEGEQTIDSKKTEFSRVLIAYFMIALFFAFLGRSTGYDAQNPGWFALFLSAILWILSITGFLAIQNASFGLDMIWFDQYIIAIITTAMSVSIFLTGLRRATQ